MKSKETFPIRINKYVALSEKITRREADRLIEKKRVRINGRLAVLGETVGKNDSVEVRKERSRYSYFAYHKPEGVVSHSPQRGERSVADMIDRADIFPIGRLDKASRGLMILSNDGRLSDRLLSPEREHEKEYIVLCDKSVSSSDIKRLEEGVRIENYHTRPAKVQKLSTKKVSVTITEGKKHQIRRMFAALGYRVEDLMRVRILHITLADLAPNTYRPLSKNERSLLLETLGLKN